MSAERDINDAVGELGGRVESHGDRFVAAWAVGVPGGHRLSPPGGTMWVMTEQQVERVSYVTAWEDDVTQHPVVAELRAHPRRWAQVDMDTYIATRDHPQVQHRSGYDSGVPRAIRWIPDPVMAAIVTLKEAGYGS